MRASQLSMCTLFLALGCGGDDAVGDDGGSPALDAAGSTDAGTDAGSFDASTDPETDAGSIDAGGSPDAGSPAGIGVRYVGRFDDTDPRAVRFSWSGSGFVTRFRGTGARATLRGGRYFTVVVDGEVQPDPLEVSASDGTYDLAAGLTEGEHRVEVYRRNSAGFGATVVGGVAVEGERLADAPPARQMEIVGDSWSTGHGVEGSDRSCTFSPETENHFLTWGAIAARAVDAELSTVALGGKGVVRGFDGSRMEQMVTLYERVIATDAASTGTIRPVDAVFVSLGANDFIDGELPGDFVSAYTLLLEKIRSRHPGALIACIWLQLEAASETARIRTAIDAAIAARAAAGDTRVLGADLELPQLVDFGCDAHPGVQTHVQMADKTIAFLRAELGW